MKKHIPENFLYIQDEIRRVKEQNGTSLNLTSFSIQEIPKEVWSLTSLKTLDLANNIIEYIPKEIENLYNLETLNININRIQVLPPEITKLEKLTHINILGNPLTSPPIEIVHRGTAAIKNYFQSLGESEQVVQIFEAKVLIVGEGGVGKTALMKRIVFDKFDKEINTTEGIEIDTWYFSNKNIDKFKVNFWDFGGQEIYHSTHQFFLTKRSLYLFVWEARKDDNLLSFDYWLNIIELLGNKAPVIVIQNKIDERIRMIDENSIAKKFKSIRGFYKVSANTGTNIEYLNEEIKNEILKLDHVGDKVPKVWYEIREKLENLDANFISIDEYLSVCKSFAMDEGRSLYLSQYFHDLGVFLHFQDNEILRNIIFLKPEWATNAVYKIVDTKDIQLNYGKFNYEELRSIWNNYPNSKYLYLLELMKKFEICFQIPKTDSYIIPELLKSSPPKFSWNHEDNLKFEYYYEFMPAGILTRFIVRNHDLILDSKYWKHGVLLFFDDTYALLVNDQLDRKVKIAIRGKFKPEFLGIIRREFDYLHKTLNSPKVMQMVQCSCLQCSKCENPYFFEYNTIRKFKAKGFDRLVCHNSVEEVSIGLLLGNIETRIYDEGGGNIYIENIDIREGQTNFADVLKIVKSVR